MELEHRAWHVAGHAYAATAFGFPIHKLALKGFAAGELADCGAAQRLDEWTMLFVPDSPWSGEFYGNLHERLTRIALAGPIQELLHRKHACTLKAVEAFSDDWRQAWRAAGALWPDEARRTTYLQQEIARGEFFYEYTGADFVVPVAQGLLDRGTLTRDEIQDIWDQSCINREKWQNRPASRRMRLTPSE